MRGQCTARTLHTSLNISIMSPQDFEVYRPPLPAHKLLPKYATHRSDQWAPALSYKLSLSDVKNQLTPAEQYRHQLATSGKHIRLIQRLELRINRNVDAFTQAASVVQRAVRGMIVRREFNKIKDELKANLELRRTFQSAVEAYKRKDYPQTVEFCRRCKVRSEENWLMEIKSLYYLAHYREAISSTEALRGKIYLIHSIYI
jgi:hypothetical protein